MPIAAQWTWHANWHVAFDQCSRMLSNISTGRPLHSASMPTTCSTCRAQAMLWSACELRYLLQRFHQLVPHLLLHQNPRWQHPPHLRILLHHLLHLEESTRQDLGWVAFALWRWCFAYRMWKPASCDEVTASCMNVSVHVLRLRCQEANTISIHTCWARKQTGRPTINQLVVDLTAPTR